MQIFICEPAISHFSKLPGQGLQEAILIAMRLEIGYKP
jgi:hypothetical protein